MWRLQKETDLARSFKRTKKIGRLPFHYERPIFPLLLKQLLQKQRYTTLNNVACMNPRDARVDAVCWDDLLRDYGCLRGEYALEADAFARFRPLAEEHRVSFEAEAYDGDDSLMVVEIERRFLTPGPD